MFVRSCKSVRVLAYMVGWEVVQGILIINELGTVSKEELLVVIMCTIKLEAGSQEIAMRN